LWGFSSPEKMNIRDAGLAAEVIQFGTDGTGGVFRINQ
jgi:hypothetical protein